MSSGSTTPQLSILNHPPTQLEGPALLHQLVRQSSSISKPAIDFLGNGSRRRTLSYESLHSMSSGLACKILHCTRGIEHVSPIVPLLIPQCPELYISLLAILKAGKAFCPLNLDTPEERLQFILKDVSANLLITTSSLRDTLPPLRNVQLLIVDEELGHCEHAQQTEDVHIRPEDLAYVLYTSGSTGLPKAVAVPHRAATQSLLAHDRHIPLFSRFLQFAAPTFDVSIFEIFFPLFRGCTLVGCSRVHMLNDLPEIIAELAVDAAELTPTVVSNLLRGRESVPGLRLLLTIGEPLTKYIVNEYGGSGSRKSILWGMYGPTEAAIHCTIHPDFQSSSLAADIGFPFDTVSAFITSPIGEGRGDDHSSSNVTILPMGEVGELVVGGPQVAREYLNRPELNARTFIQHPEYGYLYRTGDKARILPNGNLECLGRIGFGQVKLRGQRVELGEIEQAISKVDHCHTVKALVVEDKLVAFCAITEGEVSQEMVLEACKRWLPGYMVPSDIIFLERMPQVPSGKIDKKALEAIYLSKREKCEDPSSETMDEAWQPIVGVIEEVLGRKVAPTTVLSSAGLDSLRSIRIASMLRSKGFALGAVDILSAKHLSDLLSLCVDRHTDGCSASAPLDHSSLSQTVFEIPEIEKSRSQVIDILPCSFLQEAMLAETVARPEAYCNWVETEFSMPYTFTEIRGFLLRVAKEHNILRTGFVVRSSSRDAFAQIIWEDLAPSQIVEVSHFSKTYSLGSTESLQRPFCVQVNTATAKPRLLFQIHHALYDGWSFDILLQSLHNAAIGLPSRTANQYREVVNFYSSLRRRGGFDASLRYWKNLLDSYQPTPLPNFNGKTVPYRKLEMVAGKCQIDSKALHERSREWGINAQVPFQAALAYLVGSYTGTSDVVIGTVTSGRTIPVAGIDEIMGPCIASLPLRVNLAASTSVKSLLNSLHESNRAMLEHCTVPLRDIKKATDLHPKSRLFDVLFVWQESLLSVDNDTRTIRIVDSADDLEFKVTLEIEPRKDGVFFKATYDPCSIPESQIEHLLRQMDELVTWFLESPRSSVEQAGGCFCSQTLSIANPEPEQETLHAGPESFVEQWAELHPNRDALVFGSLSEGRMIEEEKLTFSALNRRANRLAHKLIQMQVLPDELVGVLLEKSADLYVSILATLKSGAAYVPITPNTPPERVFKILEETGARVCISEKRFSERVQSNEACAFLDLPNVDLADFPEDNPKITYNGSHLAYAIFTSGSTGTPKGVLVTRHNLMSNLQALSKIYPTSHGSRLLQSCSQAFDVSVFDIFFTWYSGMCLCAATKDDLFYDFEAAINQLGVTHLSLTPTVASLISPENVPTVKFLVCAGEPLGEHVRKAWAGKGLYQGYGPSETTNIVTLRQSVTMDDICNNIGEPFQNSSAFVLNPANSTILPRGAIGEICFGGEQVFRGYLNQPELNAMKILDHPSYGRIYRTGDLGLLLPDNSILFHGRLDDQVKIRGQRVELGEINSCIAALDFVRDCACVVFGQASSAHRLIAFWVPLDVSTAEFSILSAEKYPTQTARIFETLAMKLPEYMVPTNLIPISTLPMTTQSKLDKRLLTKAFEGLTASSLELMSFQSPSTNGAKEMSETEKQIAMVLANTLGISESEIHRNSSFFSLGLDSISAIAFSKALRERGFSNIPVSAVLLNPTLSRLSSKIEALDAAAESARSSIKADICQAFPVDLLKQIESDFQNAGKEIERVLPCTPLQEAMLSNARPATDSAYCNTMVFNLCGDIKRLQGSWSAMFKRHEILRTCFVPTEHSRYAFAQVITPYKKPEWGMVKADKSDTASAIGEYTKTIIPRLLQSNLPPVHLALLEDCDSTKLIFCCHHALYDGVAMERLLNEVEDTYRGTPLPSPVGYDRYLQYMMRQDLSTSDAFWGKSLADYEPSYFPDLTGKSSRADLRTAHSSVQWELEIPLSEILQRCHNSKVSLLPMVQAAWAKLLHFYLGENDLCFGNVVSGRGLSAPELERLVAPCFNTLPVRVNFDFGQSNEELIRHLHRFNLDSIPFQLTPLRRIQATVQKAGGNIFDTLFILQQPAQGLDNSIWRLEEDTGDMDIPVVCEVCPDDVSNTLKLTVHHHHSVLTENDAKVVAETFNYALLSCVRFPELPAQDTAGFPSRLLSNYNMEFSSMEPSNGPLLHSAFEYNAATRPDSVALDFQLENGQRRRWSFKELNEAANRIAHALIEQHVQPEDIVPVCMGKSPQFYASILGILKAGGAFAPFHPDLPSARKQFMLAETKAKVIVHTNDSPLTWCQDVVALNVDTLGQYSPNNPTIQKLKPTNLAYCLYTSGSTGVPKAVGMEHRSPIQTVESSRSLLPWGHDSRLLQYAAITFDMCYYDCFLAWTFGFCLCAATQDDLLDNVTGIINSMEITLLDLTPSVASGLLKEDVPTVKCLYCIGEAMKPEIVHRWGETCVNSYGPTEAAFCCTIFPVSRDIKTTVIGKPFPTTSFSVFPKKGDRALPIFGVGELYIGGAQVARGYHSNPDLTASQFIQRNGQRLYKSGDTVRMLSDGNFEFVGRVDDQVKIRGLRVELGEINHVLQDSDDNIASVTTQILKKSPGVKDQLVSFISLKHSMDEPTMRTLRDKAHRAVTKNLPPYMVPQFFLFIDRIPLSRAGKVDKATLTKIFIELEESTVARGEETNEHEWTQTEEDIRQIVSKLSNTPSEQISANTTIHQLGLDSISAVQVAAALRRKDYSVSATDVLKHPSCASLASVLHLSNTDSVEKVSCSDFESFEKRALPQICEAYDIRPESVEAVRPCTPLQRGLISQFISKEGAVYFNYLRFQLEPHADASKLRLAWNHVMMKHPILRTGFVHLQDKENPLAMVHYTPSSSQLPWQEMQEGTSPSLETDEWLQASSVHTFHHLHQPPWIIRIVQKGNDRFIDLGIFHGLFDAQSLQAILNDVSVSYHGLPESPAAPLDPVLSTLLNLSSGKDAQQRSFWRELGRGAVPTKFPNMAPVKLSPAPPVVLSRPSSGALVDIEAGCRQSNITLQAAGLASWSSILAAYTGESHVTCGVVLSGRSFEAAESAVFPCITTVPFVSKVTENKRDLLEQIMSLSASMQSEQFLPLTDIQKEMGYPNEPLFDSIFVYQKIPNSEDGQKLWEIVDEKATVDFPISFEMEPRSDRLEYRLTFLPHLVPQEQAVLILDQFDHFMKEYVFSAEDALELVYDNTLYSITPAKENTLLSEASLLHHFVEISAQKYPTRIALEFATSIHRGKYASTWLNYEQMDSEGNRIANMLLKRNVRPGSLIGICFDKCIEASLAILGILKAGCAFVALDPGAPLARKAYIIKDSEATLVLSMKAQSADLERALDVPVLNMDERVWASSSNRQPVLRRPVTPQDRSYCLYTSGTTGNPKGCELTHENAVQAMLAFQRLFAGHWDENSRWLQFASFHFDVSVLEQFWSWSVGIRLVSAPRDVVFEDLANSIRVLGVTHIDLTPSLARILHPDDVPSLCRGVFITGGESLRQDILDAWGSKGVIYNGYGPTEATIGVTMYPRVPVNGKPSNIGPQFDNVGSYVLRPNSDIPVLRGGVGELCVSGKLVGKGYLNRPELTEERFAHLKRFDERVYRTGDLVRILHDNTFDFLGRADDQVKLRGQRLEIGEINAVIKQSAPSISDVATLVLKHPKQQKNQLVAFVVGANSRKEPQIVLDPVPELKTAKEACREKLPGYMIPTHFVALTTMPLSPNNKADAKKLKQMYNDLSVADLQVISGSSNATEDSWSREEEKMRDILADVTGIDAKEVRKSSSFFELGLDSVSAINFTQRLKQAGFKKAQASVIMKNTSIGRLARALNDRSAQSDDAGSIIAAQQSITAIQHRHRRTVAEALGVDARDIEAIAPCTPLQQGMIARSLNDDQALYFNAFRFTLAQDIDEDKLRDAWKTMFEATPILRTCFSRTEDGYVQAVLRRPAFPWKTASVPSPNDVASVAEDLRRAWRTENRAVMKKPFELVLLSDGTHKILLAQIFHALYDGNSIEMILSTVHNIYHGRWNEDSGPSFQSALPYGPLRVREGAKEFWQHHLTGTAYQPLPILPEGSEQASILVTREVHALSGLETTRRKLNVTPQAIMQACWVTVLQRFTQNDASMGIIVSGRSFDFDGAERVMGPLFNTLPYHHRRQEQESWSSVIKHCHEFNVASHPYQHTPLRDIRKWCKLKTHEPLFDTLFVYQRDDKNAPAPSKNNLWELVDDSSDPDYPMAIEIHQSSDSNRLTLTLVAKGHILDPKMGKILLGHFEEALNEVLRNPDETIDHHPHTHDKDAHTPVSKDVVMRSSDFRPKEFVWTNQASTIRAEVSRLADTPVEEIDESTSIFELGLDSIDAIKLSSKLKKHGIDLSVSFIMRALTISNMVEQICRNGRDKFPGSYDMVFKSHKRKLQNYLRRRGMNTNDIVRILPLTPLQEAMVADMITSEYKRYFNHDVMKLRPETDVESLKRAWNSVYEASPILRTSFIEVDDPNIDFSYAQIVHKASEVGWQELNLDKPEFEVLFESIRKEAASAKLDASPFQIRHVRCGDDSFLVLSIAHALYDGWSLGLLHDDVHRAYEGQFNARPDYEGALREILTTSGSEAAAFWRDYLFETKGITFPRREGANASGIAQVHRSQRGSQLSISEILAFAKKNNITLQAIGQTVYSLVLAFYLQSLDVAFGSVLSGRDDDTRQDLLFPTMNTVAVRMVLHGTRREMLRYAQDNFSILKQWQHFPLRKAQAMSGVSGPLFDTLFIYQKRDKNQLGGSRLYESIEGQSDVDYPVCVEMEVVDDQLVWRCACKEEVFTESETEELLQRLDKMLKDVIENVDAPTITFDGSGTAVTGLPSFTDGSDSGYEGNSSTSSDVEMSPVRQSSSTTAEAIREVLALVSKVPVEEITDGTTIFHIGLDSISAIKVSSLLRKRSIELSVGEMLRAGTVEKMAEVADERQSPVDTEDDAEVALGEALKDIDTDQLLRPAGIAPEEIEQVLPASAGQVYMISAWVNSNGTLFYPEFKYKLDGTIPFEDLRASWNNLVAANPILRTVVLATNNSTTPYIQYILSTANNSIFDVTGLDQGARQQLFKARASKQPFVWLFAEQCESGWDLRLRIHHALYDGVSLAEMTQQLQALCNGDKIPSSTGFFEQLLATSASEKARQTRKAFWTSYLDGVTQNARTRQPTQISGRRVELFKPAVIPDIAALEHRARKHGLSIQSLFLAAYAKIYATSLHSQSPDNTQLAATTDSDIVIGIYLANRAHLGNEALSTTAAAITPTVNLVPLRVCSPRESGVVEMAQQIQYDVQEISRKECSGVALWEIENWTGVVVDVWVNWLKLPDSSSTDEDGLGQGMGKGREQIDGVPERDDARRRGMVIQDAGRLAEMPFSRVVDAEKLGVVDEDGNGEVLALLKNEHVNKTYLHAVDVEASVRNGALDMGVFGLVEMLGLDVAERMVRDILGLLGDV